VEITLNQLAEIADANTELRNLSKLWFWQLFQVSKYRKEVAGKVCYMYGYGREGVCWRPRKFY